MYTTHVRSADNGFHPLRITIDGVVQSPNNNQGQQRRRNHRRGALRWLQPRTPPTPYNHQWREMDARSQANPSPPPSYNPDGAWAGQPMVPPEGPASPTANHYTSTRSPSTPQPLQDRLIRLMGDVRRATNTPPSRPTPAPAPSERSTASTTRQRFSEWLRERSHADPLGPPTGDVDAAQNSRAASPPCSIRSVSTSDNTPPIRRHRQRATISPEDTLYNLGCHLLEKEITIRQAPDGAIIFEHDNTIPYFQPCTSHS
jgi:hypothetical protein